MTIGEKLRQARNQAGLTQKELGERLGISQAAIGQFEKKDSNPTLDTIQKIANALGISIHKILDREDIHAIFDNYIDTVPPEGKSIELSMDNYGISIKEFTLQEKIVNEFNKLNNLGQTKAIEQVMLLTRIPEYVDHDRQMDEMKKRIEEYNKYRKDNKDNSAE